MIRIRDYMNKGLWGLVLRLEGLDILSVKYYISSILEVIVIIGGKVIMIRC